MIHKVIYTHSIGRRMAPQRQHRGWRMIAFTDVAPPAPWEWVPVDRPENESIERQNRRIKLTPPFFAHQSIYIDANIELLAIPSPDADIAIHRHRERDCIFAEIAACITLGKADPDVLRRQGEAYDEHPRHWGLWECGMIFRRHTPEILDFSRAWHDEIEAHSHRDQISLPWVARRRNQQIESLGNNAWKGGLWCRRHPKK